MNEILQQLARRKSVRAYEEVPVTAEEKRLIPYGCTNLRMTEMPMLS